MKNTFEIDAEVVKINFIEEKMRWNLNPKSQVLLTCEQFMWNKWRQLIRMFWFALLNASEQWGCATRLLELLINSFLYEQMKQMDENKK